MFLDENDEVPYDALIYTIAVVNYGGRVTDLIDERLILGLLKSYTNPKIMGGVYKYNSTGEYYNPEDLTLESIEKIINGLPRNDDPEVFGMHPNAMITC